MASTSPRNKLISNAQSLRPDEIPVGMVGGPRAVESCGVNLGGSAFGDAEAFVFESPPDVRGGGGLSG